MYIHMYGSTYTYGIRYKAKCPSVRLFKRLLHQLMMLTCCRYIWLIMGDVKDCISYRDRKWIHTGSEFPWILIIHGNFRRNRILPKKDIHGNLKSTHPPHRGGHFFRCLSLLSLGLIPRRFFGGFDSVKPRKLWERFLKRSRSPEVFRGFWF